MGVQERLARSSGPGNAAGLAQPVEGATLGGSAAADADRTTSAAADAMVRICDRVDQGNMCSKAFWVSCGFVTRLVASACAGLSNMLLSQACVLARERCDTCGVLSVGAQSVASACNASPGGELT